MSFDIAKADAVINKADLDDPTSEISVAIATAAPTEDLVQQVVDSAVTTTGSTVRTTLDANYAPMMVGKVLQATGVAGTDDANLASEAAAAAAFGIPLQLIGDFRLQGPVTITGPIEIRGQGATITQTAHLVKGLKVDGNNVKISGINLEGIPSDWVNNTTVYGAGGILILGTASDVTIENCIINGFAGSSVMINSGASNTKLLNNTLTGPGATIIPQGLAGQEGIAIYNESSGSFVVEGNDISGYAQGMITIPSENYRIVNNLIHDIPGQHGMYLHLHTGAVIEGNQVWNTGLNGMKLQMDVAADADITDVVVSGNIFRQTGDAALVVTNTGTADPSRRGRRIVISNNVVTESGTNTSSGDGITVDHCAGVIISGNIVTTAGRNGIHVDTCSQAKVFNNLIDSAAYDGILLNATSDWEIGYNRVKDSATANNSSNEYGIQLTNGSGTTTDGVVRGNIITDANANMRYGIYVTSADLPNIDIIDNAATGATDYGFRGLITPTAARSFARNRLAGGLGAMLNPPSNYDTVHPEDFGAVGDGATDDSAAIAAAITAAHTAGGKVVLAAGKTYGFGSVLAMKSGTNIDGNGATLKYTGSTDRPITFTSLNNVEIANLTLDVGSAPPQSAIFASSSDKIVLRRVKVTASTVAGVGIRFNSCTNSVIDSCQAVGVSTGFNINGGSFDKILYSTATGVAAGVLIAPNSTTPATDIDVIGVVVNGFPAGVVLGYPIRSAGVSAAHNQRIRFSNCTVVGPAVGYLGTVTGTTQGGTADQINAVYTDGYTVTGCTSQGGGDMGFSMTNVTEAILTGNFAQLNCTGGIAVSSSCSMVTVTGNTCINNGKNYAGTTADIGRFGIGAGSASNVTIAGNTVGDNQATPTQNYGIRLQIACDNITVSGNTYKGNVLGKFYSDGTCTNIHQPTESITPEMYGAIGNGTTDDATAFSLALTSAVAANLPLSLTNNKTYALASTITLPAGSIIESNGATLKYIGASALRFITMSSNTVLRGVTVDCNSLLTTNGLWCSSVDGVLIDKCYVKNMTAGDLISFASVTNSEIKDTTCDTGYMGVHIYNASSFITLRDVKIKNWEQRGIYVAASTTQAPADIDIFHCKVTNLVTPSTHGATVREPIQITGSATARIQRVRVEDSKVVGSGLAYTDPTTPGTADQFNASYVDGLMMRNNISIFGGDCGFSGGQNTAQSHIGNYAAFNDTAGIAVGGTSGGSTGIVVSDNTLVNNHQNKNGDRLIGAGPGIYLYAAFNALLTGNNCGDTQTIPTQAVGIASHNSCSNIKMVNNDATGTTFNKLFTDDGSSTNLVIEDTHLPNAPTTGTWVQGQRVVNSAPAVGQPKAWLFTATGGLATKTWAQSTAYNAGDWVSNTSSHILLCLTSGTSGTGANAVNGGTWGAIGNIITDGTVSWVYMSNATATFVSEGNL